jgi:hypothetical protein
VEVPGKIVLRLALAPGLTAWRSALHAIGRAQALAGAGEELPPERRRLGDPATGLGFGLLFENVLHDEAWLRRYLRLTQGESREAARIQPWQIHSHRTELETHCFQSRQVARIGDRNCPPRAEERALMEKLRGIGEKSAGSRGQRLNIGTAVGLRPEGGRSPGRMIAGLRLRLDQYHGGMSRDFGGQACTRHPGPNDRNVGG